MSARQLWITSALLVSLALAAPALGQELYRLSVDGAKKGLRFGAPLAADGDLLVLGSPHHGWGFAGARVVRLSTGSPVAELSPASVMPGDRFGASVAVRGDLVLVGAPLTGKRGAAYLFSATGTLLRALPAVAGNRVLGTAVDLDARTAVVGDPAFELVGTGREGSVHVFDAATGVERLRLIGPAGDPTGFGASVAVGDGRVLVGAPLERAAHVFDLATGSELFAFAPSAQLAGYEFGTSVAVEGDLGLVGSPSNMGVQGGSAHLYDLTSGQLLRTFLAPEPQWDNRFGAAVALVDGRAAIGAPQSDAAKPLSGAAFVFDVATGELLQELSPGDGAKGDGYGAAVALASGLVAVGAPGRDGTEKDAGRAHVHCGPWPVGRPYCGPATPNSTGLPARLAASGCDFARVNRLRLEATQLPPHRLGLFLAGRTPGFVPFYAGSQGHLCLGGTFGRATAVAQSDAAGVLALPIDLEALPPPLPPAVQAGETWYFQAFYRDANPGPTSNLTEGLAIAFR